MSLAATTARPILLGLALVLAATAASADDPPPAGGVTSARAKEAVAERDAALRKADEELAKRQKEAHGAFVKRLDVALKEAMKRGDLDEANRLNALKKTLDAELDAEEEAAALTSAASREARAQHDAAVRRAREDHAKKVAEAHKACAKKLDAALKEVMRKGDLAEATRIDKEKKASEEELLASDLKTEGGWAILFRSSDPAIWNTDHQKGESSFAVTLDKAPRLARWVRLRRMDTKEYAIVPITKEKLSQRATDGDVAWEGSCQFGQGGRHLGIDKKEWHCTVRDGGKIMVTHDRGNRGWGFGHKVHVNDAQYWSWAGEEIPETVLEIAVKAGPLTRAEAERVVK